MNRTPNIKINAFLNVLKSCLSIIFPLVTYPIVLKSLGTVGVGKVSYVQSIISYFAMFAMLGVSTYAVREGSRLREDKVKLKKIVSEVLTINFIFTILSCVVLFFLVSFVPAFNNYTLLFSILWLEIVFRTFSIEWINTIFEDYLYITIRSIVIYIISLILIILCINDSNDYWIYAILLVVPNGIVCLSNWFYCRKYVSIRLTHKPNMGKHIKPLFVLFFNAIMVSIYVNFDTTMLGWIKGDHYVGLYSLPVKVYTVMKSLLTAVYSVTVARLSLYAGKKDWDAYKNLFSKICNSLSLILIPVGVGIFSVSNEIVYLFGGVEYLDSVIPLKILSIALVFSIFSGLVTACLIIPLKKDKVILVATSISAISNCILNVFFINWLNCNGAAITTVIAEAFVLFYCFGSIKEKNKYIDFIVIRKNIFDAFLGAVVIFSFCQIIKSLFQGMWMPFCIKIIGSIILYVFVLVIRKNEYLIIMICKIKKKLTS